jgi:hypothetical protein
VEPPELGATDETLLDRYWDEVVLGLTEAQAALDPTDVAVIQQLHRRVRLRGTDGTFRRRLRRDLLRTPTLPVSSGPSALTPDRAWHQGAAARSSRSRNSWLAQAATVLLVIGTVALLVFAFYGRRPDQPVVIVPAVDIPVATPGATPPSDVAPPQPAAIREDTLLTVSFAADAIPRWDRAGSSLVHYRISPDSETTWDEPGVLRVEYVVAGTYTVRSDGPTQIVRVGGAGAPEAIPAATPVDLGPGDALVVPFETASDYTNQGEIPIDLVQWRLHEDDGRGDRTPIGWQSANADLRPGVVLPVGPTTLRLRRVELAPDTERPAVSGVLQMGVTLPTIGVSATPNGVIGHSNDGRIISVGSRPAVVYVLTLDPTASGNDAVDGVGVVGEQPETSDVVSVAPVGTRTLMPEGGGQRHLAWQGRSPRVSRGRTRYARPNQRRWSPCGAQSPATNERGLARG